MTDQDWAKKQQTLLQDIERFSRDGPLPSGEAPPPELAKVAAPKVRPSPAAVASPTPVPAAEVAPQAAAKPAAAPASSLLNQLKQQAMAKLQTADQQTTLQKELQQRISDALEMTYKYLNDLCQQLNIIKPPYSRAFPFFGVVDFDGLLWQEGRADFRLQAGASDDRFYDQVTLRFRLAGPKQYQVMRENPLHEKLHKLLFDNNIAFTTEEARNERGYIERATFTFPCDIKAGLQLSSNFSSGRLVLRTRHIDRFGVIEYQFGPEAVTQESLDELARMILGEPNRIAQLFERTA